MDTNPNPQQSKSQNQRILEYLQTGKTLTPLEALELFNCWALSSRCSDINKMLANEGKGARIDCKLVTGADGKKYGEYSYVEPVEPDFDDEIEFEPYCNCDLPDACADFGCAIKQGLRSKNPNELF